MPDPECRNPKCTKERQAHRLMCEDCWKLVPNVLRTAYYDAKLSFVERGNVGYQIIWWLKENTEDDR